MTPINYLAIRHDFLGIGRTAAKEIIAGLENSDRTLIKKIFETANPKFNPPRNEVEALKSLHERVTYKEEETGCGPFAWFINLFKGPWFEGIRVFFGGLESSSDLSAIVEANDAKTLLLDAQRELKLKERTIPVRSPPETKKSLEDLKALLTEIKSLARDQIAYEGTLREKKSTPEGLLTIKTSYKANQDKILDWKVKFNALMHPPQQL